MMITAEATLAEIDEALAHLRERLQDRYGNRLTYQQKQLYLSSVDDLLDARLSLTGGNREDFHNRTIPRP
jgi:hypothetical protein